MAMMKKKNRKKAATGLAAVMVSLSSLSVYDVVAKTVSVPVFAHLIGVVSITLQTSLDFGSLALMTNERAGKATIDPFTNQLFVDGHSSLTAAGGKPRAGRVQIKNTAKDRPIQVSVENTVIQLTNGGDSIVTIENFNFATSLGGHAITITPSLDQQTFLVDLGATLKTRPGQIDGIYTGVNRVSASFQ